MTERPSKEEEAQRKLDAAIEEYLNTIGWSEGVVLTGYAMVVSQHGFNDQGEEISAYPVIYLGGTMPDHAALGLFHIGIDTVSDVGRWARPEQ